MKKISGVGKKHILKGFFKRINTPYDLRIRDAIDGEEMLHLSLTKKSIYILFSSFMVGSFILVSLLFLFTPIKYYIPGFETTDSRKRLVQLQAQIDSLESYQKNYSKLFNNTVAVLSDDESFLLDTTQLDSRQLSKAEMYNQQEVGPKNGSIRKSVSAIKKETMKGGNKKKKENQE